MVELGWSRDDAEEYIKSKGLDVPMRSGCWFCPFQRKSQWRRLAHDHPDLLQKVKELEREVGDRLIERGGTQAYIDRSMRPIEYVAEEGQMAIEDLQAVKEGDFDG